MAEYFDSPNSLDFDDYNLNAWKLHLDSPNFNDYNLQA
jgi:hypothetical protein